MAKDTEKLNKRKIERGECKGTHNEPAFWCKNYASNRLAGTYILCSHSTALTTAFSTHSFKPGAVLHFFLILKHLNVAPPRVCTVGFCVIRLSDWLLSGGFCTRVVTAPLEFVRGCGLNKKQWQEGVFIIGTGVNKIKRSTGK